MIDQMSVVSMTLTALKALSTILSSDPTSSLPNQWTALINWCPKCNKWIVQITTTNTAVDFNYGKLPEIDLWTMLNKFDLCVFCANLFGMTQVQMNWHIR